MGFAELVKSTRLKLGMTQAEFAAALGFGECGERTVRRWETGECLPEETCRYALGELIIGLSAETLESLSDSIRRADMLAEEFPDLVVSKRTALGLTQRQFAQLLHMGRGAERTIRRWEAGDGIPQNPCLYAVTRQIQNVSLSAPYEQRDGAGRLFDFIDLFAGIGGMHLAYEDAGGRCVYASEWDRWCCLQYQQNFGMAPDGDITMVPTDAVPAHDILVAGFPCQPFSIAGVSKKNSLGRPTGFADKTQGTLFFDVARIIDGKRPAAFMLENVKNLMSHDHGNTWLVIRETLEELDYAIFPKVLDGDGLVPQHRERLIIVGFDRRRFGDQFDFSFDIVYPEKRPVLRDILEDDVDDRYTLSDGLWEYLQAYAAKHRAKGNGFGYGMPDLDGSSRTLSARYYKDGSEVLIDQGPDKNPRKLTPRECARLQGFPDAYRIVVSDTQAYKEFGNSVVVPLMGQVAKLVYAKLVELGWTTVGRSNPSPTA